MTSGSSTAGFILGVIVGGIAGYILAVVQRAFRDLAGARASIPGLRRNAWRNAARASVAVAAAAALLYGFVGWVSLDVDRARTGPASTTAPATPAGR